MEMIISVIADRFIDKLVDELMEKGISVTEISSTGGFLSQGNTTLVIGLEKEKFPILDEVFRRVISDQKLSPEESGAHLFSIDLERGLHI